MDENYLVAYKLLDKNMQDEWKDFKFELNKWYRSIDIDMSSKEYSFGLLAVYYPFQYITEETDIYVVHISKDYRIKHLEDGFIRCECMKIVGKYNSTTEAKNWSVLNEMERKRIVRYLKGFEYKLIWPLMNDKEKNDCSYFIDDFDYLQFWDELDGAQRTYQCRKKNFDYKKLWKKLTEDEKECVILNNENFEHQVCWHTLSKKLQAAVIFKQNQVQPERFVKILDETMEGYNNQSSAKKLWALTVFKDLDFDLLWKSSKEKKRNLITKNMYFPFEKYWDILSDEQKKNVISNNLDVATLWTKFNEFTTEQKQSFAYRTYVVIGE